MFFSITNMIAAGRVIELESGSTMTVMLIFGLLVMSIFTFGYMIYLNSFLIKRRKKEFGLYAVLGLEKKHVGRIVFLETVMLNLSSVFTGIVFGIVFGRMLFMILMKLTTIAAGSAYALSPTAFASTFVFFFVIFIVNNIVNQIQVRTVKPVELMSASRRSDKEPKAVGLMTLVGIICLAAAYIFSVFIRVPALALTFFWPAVVLVIVGTNLLFISGTRFFLLRKKNNKKKYYKPANFISVSTLMYRLKQNANGLANICILSTMVLVTVSFCCALYFGHDSILQKQNPYDAQIELFYDKEADYIDFETIDTALREFAETKNVKLSSGIIYYSLRDSLLLSKGDFHFKDENGEIVMHSAGDYSGMYSVYILPVEYYNAVCGGNASLKESEVIILTDKVINNTEELQTPGGTYKIKAIEKATAFTDGNNGTTGTDIFFVVKDAEACDKMRGDINPGIANDKYISENICSVRFFYQLDGAADDKIAFENDMGYVAYRAAKDQNPELEITYSYNGINTSRVESYALYGGLLFMGIFFAVLFLVNTVIIMYFKQVSEGYDDRARYDILQKVGMGDDEIKETINSQIRIVFLLPIITALTHILMASNLLIRMLEAFVMTDVKIALLWMVITSVAFTAVYYLAYKQTSKVYFRIVKN